MAARPADHLFIFLTVLFTVYSQLIMRWQVGSAGPLPEGLSEKAFFVGALLVKPWVLTAIVATFFAGVSWMLAMTRFEVSYAFPFVSLNYVAVLLASILLFHESFGAAKLVGTGLIIAGIFVIARG